MQRESDINVTKYYTQFKSLFEELDELQSIPECNCGAFKFLTKRDEDQCVHLFLWGLDTYQFSHIKSTILNFDSLPPLWRIFNQIQWEKSRLTTETQRRIKTNSGLAFHLTIMINQSGVITQNSNVTTVVRMAMSKINASKFMDILQGGNP